MSRIVNSTANAVASARQVALSRMSCQAATGRGANREAAIRQAVVELLNETSYESVTMDAVAARAKASKATIYRRWSNKDALVTDALGSMMAGRDLDVVDTGNLRDDIVTRISQMVQDAGLAAVNTAALKVLVYAASTDPALADDMRQAIRDAQFSAWQTILQRAHTRGELHRSVDAGLLFEVAQGQFCSRTGVDAGSVDDGYIAHLVDDVMMPVILHAGSPLPRPRPASRPDVQVGVLG